MKTLQYIILLCWVVLLCYPSHAIKCIDGERKALLRFKQGIESDNCGLLSSWGDIEDCCQWRGIRCSNRTGHVIMLHLRGWINVIEFTSGCLEGKLDPSLFELTHLKYLDLSKNGFIQTIPSSIDSLTELEYLNLSSAGFFGEIPPQLGNLSKLASLDLTPQSYEVTFKSLQWMSHLTLLREIHLSDSDLSEATNWFQTINNLPSLKILYLDYCQLPATFPSSSLSYINSSTSLRVISLGGNNFNTTSIFKWLFNMSRNGNQLEYLDLSDNLLSGPVPRSFGKYMYSLSYLYFDDNYFEGSIPITFSNLRALRELSFYNNKLNGPLLNVLQALSCGCANKPLLEHLDLSMNQFWGSIPNTINSFTSIKELYLYDNHLNGTISQSIGQLSMLEILDVFNNSLKATLNHNHFLNLSRLQILDLSANPALVLDSIKILNPYFHLNVIRLRSCKLGPSFPNWLLTQTNFSYLDISNAQISGEIPPSFWTRSLSPNLRYINMSHNMIQGVLPNLSASFDNLKVIDFSSNYFEGSIPSFVGDKNVESVRLNDNTFSDATQLFCPRIANSKLVELDVSNNLLSGRLPNCLMKRDQLQYLHLENNKFTGNIPTSIGDLLQLQYLHLQNNSFSGKLPSSMLNCMSLYFLDLGYNSLTGYIPPSIGNAFEYLAYLNLRGNKFFGKLPLSLCQLSNLHMLDIAMNHISGPIPNCIYNFTAMMSGSKDLQFDNTGVDVGEDYIVGLFKEAAMIEWKREEQRFAGTSLRLVNYIDMSNNELEGEIPDGISNLTKLLSLDLSRNKLTGIIPSNIGQLASLEFLDLSNNHLSGVIPRSLADVSSLAILDLSNNNLSGRIPLGTQLRGFDPSSYMGNPLLCGAPRQGCAGDEPPPAMTINNGTNVTHQEEHGIDTFYLGLYISVVLGFIVGFWGVCGTLVVKRTWRHAFFSFFGDIKDKIYVMVVLNVARIWRKD
ncbi:LRR receptor-like serine/threonine-protein kinase GSO2 [Chenopodium quinoa]|uniref:LRR receptor-like serine/threonine-protein kinase GSO2 n=1 Tax=Chenopodium quinoa TaxID=63459 RepID=UPI000B78CE1E|nr:LRR receptor-like serine/threonine-protein kinase GSO2 [Chenopodium quinoa]